MKEEYVWNLYYYVELCGSILIVYEDVQIEYWQTL